MSGWSIRSATSLLLALAARWDLEIRQLDAVNAFPNSKLDEEVYVELPDGYKLSGKVGRLLRALHGLRRSPLLWQKFLSSALTELGLQGGLEEPCLFLTDHLIVFFFVDDICYMFRASDQPIVVTEHWFKLSRQWATPPAKRFCNACIWWASGAGQ